MSRPLDNANPTVFAPTGPTTSRRTKSAKALLWDEDAAEYQEFTEGNDSGSGEEEREEIDSEEIFGKSFGAVCESNTSLNGCNTDLLRSITDPEHPVTLEQLRVVNPEDIHVSGNRVLVYLTPTIPHCSMSTLIGKFHLALNHQTSQPR